jgi:hypothetical protein
MEERQREDGFEATFVVRTPRAEAWARLREAAPAHDSIPGPLDGQWWIPGVEGAADEIDVTEGEQLRARKATFPCEGTEIVVTMEDDASGTRITFVQHGFGPDFEERRPWLESGWWAIRADLYVYFSRGVSPGRHLRPWSSIGGEVEETPGGLTLVDVRPGGFADQAGARSGDLVLTMAGSPVLTTRELSVLLRAFPSGTETKLRYLRDREVLRGAGTL